MYLYETHCHTAPVSKCGKASAEDNVRFYKKMGYDGLFITNHFLDGNINLEVWNWPSGAPICIGIIRCAYSLIHLEQSSADGSYNGYNFVEFFVLETGPAESVESVKIWEGLLHTVSKSAWEYDTEHTSPCKLETRYSLNI